MLQYPYPEIIIGTVAFGAVFSLMYIPLYTWFCVWRNRPTMITRYPLLILQSGLFGYLTGLYYAIWLLTAGNVPCWLTCWCSYCLSSMYVYPYILRCWQTFFKYRMSEDELAQRDTWFTRNSYYGSTTFSRYLAILTVLLGIGNAAFVQTSYPDRYANSTVGCEPFQEYIFTSIALFILTFFLVSTAVLSLLMKDELNLRFEMNFCSMCWISSLAVEIGSLNNENMNQWRVFIPYVLNMSVYFVTFGVPLYIEARKNGLFKKRRSLPKGTGSQSMEAMLKPPKLIREEDRPLSTFEVTSSIARRHFLDVVISADELEDFKRYLQARLAYELYLCRKHILEFKRQFGADPEKDKKRVIEFCATFLTLSHPYAINVSYSCSSQLTSTLNDPESPLTADIFDNVGAEVDCMLQDHLVQYLLEKQAGKKIEATIFTTVDF